MENENEYVKNKCNRCLNRKNDKDLCNIVKTINGKYKCSNEDVIEIGEYIRNKDGYIGKVEKIITPDEKMEDYYYCCETTMASSYGNQIVKHNKNIIELLEKHDVISIKEKVNESTAAFELIDDIYDEAIEDIKNNEVTLLSIITKEQYKENCYEVGTNI